jgi:hypothetical protein
MALSGRPDKAVGGFCTEPTELQNGEFRACLVIEFRSYEGIESLFARASRFRSGSALLHIKQGMFELVI